MHRHDYVAFYRSKVIDVIKELKIGDDSRTPKVTSDSSCGRNEVNHPRNAEIELSILSDQERVLAVEK